LEVAGTLLTAQLALRFGLACNVAGGTHHAESNRGKGFTILNDLAVASRLMTWTKDDVGQQQVTHDNHVSNSNDINLLSELYRGEQPVERVLVVDCDVHQGDGTATFHYEGQSLHNKLFTLDLHAENNWPFDKERPTYDIPLPDGCLDDEYMVVLSTSLNKALNEVQPQLVLYNAGVDPFHGDKLGRLSLSWQGLQERDLFVIKTCVERDLPVACVVGGGYSKDSKEVGQRHALLHRVCAKVWRDLEMWKRSKSVT
jgi:acetoin utilization deacetylase AcuC-like enzyme